MTFLRLLALWLLLLTSPWAIAQNMVHQGPGLQVRVQRGDQVLPLALVDHLRAGDRLLVQPEPDTLAPGDWVLMLATVSPTGSPLWHGISVCAICTKRPSLRSQGRSSCR